MPTPSSWSCVTRPPAPLKCPWLVFSHGKHKSTQTFYNVAEDCYYVKSIPDMCQKYICASCHGWLVIMDINSDDFFLLNPVSMEKIELPPWNSFTLESCVLSLPPSNPNCIVVVFAASLGEPYIRFCRPGDCRWTDCELGSLLEMLRFPTTCNGKIYGLTKVKGSLATLEFVGSNVSVRKLVTEKRPWPSLVGITQSGAHLVESGGELYLVVTALVGEAAKLRDVEVFKMDFPSLTWLEVESLGDRAFFVDGNWGNSVSCSSAASRIKGNAIYYIDGRRDKNLYVFHLEDRSLSVSLPCPKFRHLLDTLWVMPEFQEHAKLD
ncbi:F-box/kelch-repeat protein At1g57790-like [Malania oleifera]|uniref:F-box/kelch-repeat protein At1g57790-like n=1 Tax=Malania oleifera TaxID=397392 RepID=UPI0025AE7474|nr:F-box/kelch-repeat protein At1g57790-like [Malania oleifera]